MAENDINVMQETAEGNLQEVSLATYLAASGIAAGLHDATNAQTGASVNDYVFRVYGPSGNYVDLDAGSITAVRGLYFPDASGTLALDGHTHSSLYDATNQATGLSIDNYVLSHTAANGAVTFAGTNLTGNRAYQYPDASGTLALTTSPPASHTHTAADINSQTASNGHVLTANGSGGSSFQALPASGISAIGASAADILSVSGSDLVADDPNADRLVMFDDSEGKLVYATLGTGLSFSGSTINASAGGSTNLWIPASAWIPRTTSGCGVDSRETTTNDQNFDELLFDAGSDEFADALVVMPSNYNNGTITARFYWTASAGSGDVIWGIQGRAFANDDSLDTAAGTAQTVTDTLIATNDMHVSSATSAVTIGGTPAANTPIQFTVYRDANAAGDTIANDARLLGVEIIYTAA